VHHRKARNRQIGGVVRENDLNPAPTSVHVEWPVQERGRGDIGAGLIGLMGSVLVFMIFLLFATQLLVGLYARSVVSGAAFDGAQYVARHQGAGDVGARQTVEAQVGASLVSAGVTGRDADNVDYTVIVSAPRFLSKTWLPGSADTISRTARARIERRR
jgi:hypothetical protein